MTAGLAHDVAHLWVALGIFHPAAIAVTAAAYSAGGRLRMHLGEGCCRWSPLLLSWVRSKELHHSGVCQRSTSSGVSGACRSGN